jgi:hypothetical protein
LLTLLYEAELLTDDAVRMENNLSHFRDTLQLVSAPAELTDAVVGEREQLCVTLSMARAHC